MRADIETEAQFVRKQFVFLLKLPWYVLLVLFGKKTFSELFQPLRELYHFLFEPKITITLIVLNIIMFVYTMFFMPIDLLQSLVFHPSQLANFNFIPMIVSWFLHGSVSHLIGNMGFLYIFGRIIERRFGYKTLLIYFGAAIVSDLFASLFLQGGIGASGAISGLVAAAILTDPFYITFLIFGIPIPIMLLGLLSIFGDVAGIFSSEESNIGYFAHLGGYLSITLLIYFLSKEDRARMKKGLIINLVFVALMVLLYFLF